MEDDKKYNISCFPPAWDTQLLQFVRLGKTSWTMQYHTEVSSVDLNYEDPWKPIWMKSLCAISSPDKLIITISAWVYNLYIDNCSKGSCEGDRGLSRKSWKSHTWWSVAVEGANKSTQSKVLLPTPRNTEDKAQQKTWRTLINNWLLSPNRHIQGGHLKYM